MTWFCSSRHRTEWWKMSCSGFVPLMWSGYILNSNKGRIIGQILLLNQLSDQCMVVRTDLLGSVCWDLCSRHTCATCPYSFSIPELGLLANLDGGFLWWTRLLIASWFLFLIASFLSGENRRSHCFTGLEPSLISILCSANSLGTPSMSVGFQASSYFAER